MPYLTHSKSVQKEKSLHKVNHQQNNINFRPVELVDVYFHLLYSISDSTIIGKMYECDS